LFQTLSPSIFLFSSRRKEKKNKGKKTIKKKKKSREGKEFTFKLSLCLVTFGSCFWLHVFVLLLQTLFLGMFFFLSKR